MRVTLAAHQSDEGGRKAPVMILAEIADKMPSLLAMLTVHVIVAVLALCLVVAWKWLGLIVLPASAFYIWVVVQWLWLEDEWFHAAVVRELGMHYLVIGITFSATPLVAAMLGLIFIRFPLRFTQYDRRRVS